MSDAPPELPTWIAAQLPPDGRRRMVDVGDGVQMHVQDWGPPAGRAVLLLHGNPTWSFLWRKVIAAVRALPGGAALRLIAPDLVGLGCSSKPRDLRAHTVVQHSAWLGRALDEVAPRQPVVFVGQDWGGPIGMHAFLARAERLRGIVLANTSISPPAAHSKRTMFHRLSQLPVVSDALFRGLGFPLHVLHTTQGDRGSIRGEVARAYRWPLQRIADRAAPLALARMVPDSPAHPSVAELARTQELFATARVPKHLVWGMRDPILGRALTRLAELAPNVVVTRTSAGHFLQEEVPDALAEAIVDVAARATWS